MKLSSTQQKILCRLLTYGVGSLFELGCQDNTMQSLKRRGFVESYVLRSADVWHLTDAGRSEAIQLMYFLPAKEDL